MTFEQFKYVLEVAKCGSFNQAANTMFLSQSTLSTSIIKQWFSLHCPHLC